MLRSKDLRARAWNSLKGKYWTAFAVSLIFGLIVSISGSFASFSGDTSALLSYVANSGEPIDATMQMGANLISVMGTVSAIIGLIIVILVDNPLSVGFASFFVKNVDGKPSIKELFSGFKNYGKNVKVMLILSVKLFLWFLLFIIPGIIKTYEYAIIPYILADNPEISSKEAFALAKEMMNGNKWRLFKLEFSFIGWALLCVLTLGIGAFFLVPYMEAANAEFYAELKSKQ